MPIWQPFLTLIGFLFYYAQNPLSTPADVAFAVISCPITKSSFEEMQSFNTEKDFQQSKAFISFTT